MPSSTLPFQSLPAFGSVSDLVKAWGHLLRFGHGRPDWFVTLTFRDNLGEWGCLRRFRKFVKHVRHLVKHQPDFVVVTESHRDRPTPHFHGLFYDCRDRDGQEPNRKALQEWCWDSFGKVQVLRYDPALDAADYLAKYVTKGDGLQLSISFSRDWGKTKGAQPMLDL